MRVGGRTALLMESAGTRTLAEELRGGRLALDLLERYGRDLLDIVNYLDGQGVWHRDLKPANLAARPRPKDKQPHLCVFDFALVRPRRPARRGHRRLPRSVPRPAAPAALRRGGRAVRGGRHALRDGDGRAAPLG
ncbi:hypothetical protein NKG94_45670 [Micromonospora sp. M12]